MGDIAAVLLAAGASTRLGQPKQLLSFRGQPLLRRAAEQALAAGCRPLVVVLGANAELIRPQLEHLPAVVVMNQDWALGMGSSVAAGMARVQRTAGLDAVLLMVADQPLIDSAALAALVAEYRQRGRAIAAATYAGTVGVPAVFSRELFQELSALAPEAGAKGILLRDAQRLATIPMEAAQWDLDTADDLARLRALEAER